MGQTYPVKPTNYVTDEANVLTPGEENTLDTILRTFEDQTSIQLFVYTANSLNGVVMADLCQEIFHNWKIGNKKTNNGVLIGIFVNDHKFRIHTGYGMEGVLPDLLTKKIQDEFMRPHFKRSNYFQGIEEGISQIFYYSKHEYKPETAVRRETRIDWGNVLISYLLNVPMLCVFLYFLFRKKQVNPQSPKAKTILTILVCVIAIAPFVGSLIIVFLCFLFFRNRSASGSYTSSNGSGWFTSMHSSSDYSSSDYSSSSSDFGGGGGGDSGGGGSDSSW